MFHIHVPKEPAAGEGKTSTAAISKIVRIIEEA